MLAAGPAGGAVAAGYALGTVAQAPEEWIAGITALLAHLGRTADFSKWDNWRPPSPTS